MNTSERINVIRDISVKLGGEEWTLIDLTLKQYSLPRSEHWGGDHPSYVMEMISEASDDTLMQLATHVGLEIEGERPGIEPDFWTPGFLRLFISHIAEKREYATELKTELHAYGISGFVAHADITPTREWQDEILLALTTADALVALLTPGFHASLWTDQEVGFVMGRGRLTVAVMAGESPYGFIGSLQAFAGSNKTAAELASEIFTAFVSNKQTQQRMASAVVTLFEQSNNFKSAIQNVGLLARIEHWETQFEDRIKSSISNNSQIGGAYRVPDRANRIIQKWTPPSEEVVVDPGDVPFE